MADFDLIIIGTGVAGRSAADAAVAAGLRTAMVERRDVGGTCALRGCEPKKLLFAAAETVGEARDQSGHGVKSTGALDWRGLVEFKRTMTGPAPAALATYYRDLGVTLLQGDATFVSAREVRIGEVVYSARWVLVATGAVPAPLRVPGADLVIDSEQFMELDTMPPRVAFVGGGYISFEFAAMAAAAGSSVTILHRGATPLEGFDPDLVGWLVAEYESRGIEVRVQSPVSGVRRTKGGLEVDLAHGEALPCDLVVHGAGRVPDVERLDLAAAGVASGPAGIEVDASMKSVGNDRVYAAGDVAALGMPLTPVGIAQARIAVRAMLGDGTARFDPLATPSVVFSHPPLATVGMSEAAARAAGLDIAVKLTDTSGWWSSKRVGLRHSGAKTIVEASTGRILGATLLGHGADEVVNLLSLAINRGATADELKGGLWAYPTAGSEVAYLF